MIYDCFIPLFLFFGYSFAVVIPVSERFGVVGSSGKRVQPKTPALFDRVKSRSFNNRMTSGKGYLRSHEVKAEPEVFVYKAPVPNTDPWWKQSLKSEWKEDSISYIRHMINARLNDLPMTTPEDKFLYTSPAWEVVDGRYAYALDMKLDFPKQFTVAYPGYFSKQGDSENTWKMYQSTLESQDSDYICETLETLFAYDGVEKVQVQPNEILNVNKHLFLVELEPVIKDQRTRFDQNFLRIDANGFASFKLPNSSEEPRAIKIDKNVAGEIADFSSAFSGKVLDDGRVYCGVFSVSKSFKSHLISERTPDILMIHAIEKLATTMQVIDKFIVETAGKPKIVKKLSDANLMLEQFVKQIGEDTEMKFDYGTVNKRIGHVLRSLVYLMNLLEFSKGRDSDLFNDMVDHIFPKVKAILN